MAYTFSLVSGSSTIVIGASWNPLQCTADGQIVYILDNSSSGDGALLKYTNEGTVINSTTQLNILTGYFGGVVKVLAVSDDGQTIIFGGADSSNATAMYRSTNSGTTFSEMTSSITADDHMSMCASRNLQNIVLVLASGGGVNVIYSIDFGASWNLSTTPFIIATPSDVGGLATSSNGKYVYLLIFGSSSGILFSSDYGANFTSLSSVPSNFYWIACNDNGSKVILACHTDGLYRSANFGTSWAALSSLATGAGQSYDAVSCDVTGNFIITEDTNSNHLFTSIDAGETWALEGTTGSGSGGQDQFVLMSGDHTHAYTQIYSKGYYTGVYNLVCFKEDTKILSKVNDVEQYVPIQTLRKGDLVKTLSSGYKRIEMIGCKQMNHIVSSERIAEQLYVCSKQKFPEATEDLVLTGAHSILVEKLTNAQEVQINDYMKEVYITENRYRLPAFIDGRTDVYEKEGLCSIYHFALENDSYYMNYGIYANGILVESSSQRYLKELSGMKLIE